MYQLRWDPSSSQNTQADQGTPVGAILRMPPPCQTSRLTARGALNRSGLTGIDRRSLPSASTDRNTGVCGANQATSPSASSRTTVIGRTELMALPSRDESVGVLAIGAAAEASGRRLSGRR